MAGTAQWPYEAAWKQETSPADRQRVWLTEQVAAMIAEDVWRGYDFSSATVAAEERNAAGWTLDGPVTFQRVRIEPHERDSYARYTGLSLSPEDFTRAVRWARELQQEA